MSPVPSFPPGRLAHSVSAVPVRLRWMAAGVAAIASLFTACDRSSSNAGSTPAAPAAPAVAVVARVGERTVTGPELLREMERRQATRRSSPSPTREGVLQEMVDHLALFQHARALGLDQEPAVQQEIESLMVRRVLERELAPRVEAVEVTAEEVEAAYQRDLVRYTQPAKDRLAILFLEAPAKASATRRDEARARLEDARRRILAQPAAGGRGPAARGFGTLAIDYSDDQASRYRGGDIGWLEPDNFAYRWPRVVLEAGYALPDGGVSEVLETEAGPYLVMKTDARPSQVTPLAKVEPTIRHAVLIEKRKALEDAYRREIAQRIGSRIDEAALAAVPIPEAPAPQIAQRTDSSPPAPPHAGGAGPTAP